MKKLRRLSFWISWGSVINCMIMTVFAVIIHTLYGLGYASYKLDIVAETMFISSIVIIGVAVTISSEINEMINEIRRKKSQGD